MRCDYCKEEFEEKDLHDSHDVPCYLFEGNRKGKKNQADKFGRHWLCKKQNVKDEKFCHDKFEQAMRLFLQGKAKEFSQRYFKEVDKNGDT